MKTKTAGSALDVTHAFVETLRSYLDGDLTDHFRALGFNDRSPVERYDANAQVLTELRERVLNPIVHRMLAEPLLSHLTDGDRQNVTAAIDECVRVFHSQLVRQGSASFTNSAPFESQIAAVDEALTIAAVRQDADAEKEAYAELAAAEAELVAQRDQLEAAIRCVDLERVTALRKAVVVELPESIDRARHRVLTLAVSRTEAEAAPFIERSEAAAREMEAAQAAAVAAEAAFGAAVDRRDRARTARPLAHRAAENATARVAAAREELAGHELAQEAARVQRFRVLNGV